MDEEQTFNNSTQKMGYPAPDLPNEKIPDGIQLGGAPGEIIVISTLIHDQSYFECLIRYSRIIKIASVLDALLCTLFFVGGMNFLMFLVALPVTGYCAAKYYHKSLITVYTIYLFLILLTRIALIGVIQTLNYGILQGFIVLLEIGVLTITILFYRKLGELNKFERNVLRMAGRHYIVPNDEPRRDEVEH